MNKLWIDAITSINITTHVTDYHQITKDLASFVLITSPS